MDKLNQFADHLLDYLNGAELFLKTQVPDFVQQFIAYQTWVAEWQFKTSVTVLVSLILLQIVFILLTAAGKIKDDSVGWLIGCTGLIGTVFLVCTFNSYTELKKLEIAPKVYMVEQAKHLITK